MTVLRAELGSPSIAASSVPVYFPLSQLSGEQGKRRAKKQFARTNSSRETFGSKGTSSVKQALVDSVTLDAYDMGANLGRLRGWRPGIVQFSGR